MFTRELRKLDGRRMWLYARQPIPELPATSPHETRTAPFSHLRWHPLRGEWVAYATHRQQRTFFPPPEYNPLAATTAGGTPTEVPSGAWDIAVFENRFPAFS